MNIRIAALLFAASVTSLLADDKIAQMQQQLKDEGFYYGDITGEKNADTTAAIRRFQIRSGLQVTGEINDETSKALHDASSAPKPNAVAAATPPPLRQSSPPPSPNDSDLRDDIDQSPSERLAPPPAPNRPAPPVYSGRSVPAIDGNFVGTPFANASPQVQEDVMARAQKRLAKIDLYRGQITGAFGPDFEFSLRAYQSRVGLPTTGRLDLQTLAALELLPGATERIYTPRRVYREPPVRGEWIRP